MSVLTSMVWHLEGPAVQTELLFLNMTMLTYQLGGKVAVTPQYLLLIPQKVEASGQRTTEARGHCLTG